MKVRFSNSFLWGIMIFSLLFIELFEIPMVILSSMIALYTIVTKRAVISKSTKNIVILFLIYAMLQHIVQIIAGEIAFALVTKTMFNTIVMLIVFISSYYFGYNNEYSSDGFYRIVACGTLLGAVNIYSWFVETGGVFGRYNFKSLITNSYGGDLIVCVMCFYISITSIKNRFLKVLSCFICALNVVIIQSRMQQILFLLLLLTYISIKKDTATINKYIRRGIFICLVFLVSFMILYPYLKSSYPEFFSLYERMFDKNGDDILSRKTAQTVSLQLFIERPITGIGFGLFSMYNNAVYKWSALASSHSGFYDIISETGIIGVTFYIVLFIGLIKKSIIILKSQPKLLVKMTIMVVISCAVSIFFLHNTFFPQPNQRVYYLFSSVIWFIVGNIEYRYNALVQHGIE